MGKTYIKNIPLFKIKTKYVIQLQQQLPNFLTAV